MLKDNTYQYFILRYPYRMMEIYVNYTKSFETIFFNLNSLILGILYSGTNK